MREIYLTYGNKSFGYDESHKFFFANNGWMIWYSTNPIEVIKCTIKYYKNKKK